MAIRNVIQENEAEGTVLRKISKEVKVFDEKLWELLDDMWDTMYEFDGVGLAAVQVGVLKRVIVATMNNMQLELINAKIVAQEGTDCNSEGCLSIKGVQGYVNRPYKVTVEAQDRMGMPFTITAVKDMARCLCHEIDHTNGVLFTDKTVPAPVETKKESK